MSRSATYTLLFYLLIPNLIWGQTENTESFRLKSIELYRTGINLNESGRSFEALDTFRLALEYRKKAYPHDKYYLGGTYMALGITLKLLGRNNEALESYNLAKECYNLKNDINPAVFANLYRNIGNVYRSQLDYINALNYFDQALSIYLKNEEENKIQINDSYYAIAEVNNLLGNHSKALDILKSFLPEVDDFNKIYYNELIAIINQNLHNNDDAKKYYLQTIKLTRNYYGTDHIQTAIEYLNYAEFLASVSEFDEGITNLEHAFTIIGQTQKNKGVELARYYEYKGRLFYSKSIATSNILTFRQQRIQNLKESIFWYNKCLDALYTGEDQAILDKFSTTNNLSFTYFMTILKSIADSYYELAIVYKDEKGPSYAQSIEESLIYYKKISQLLQRARQEISGDESKIQLAQLEYETFTRTIEASYIAYETEGKSEFLELAFNNSEQIKSSSVFDKISTNFAQENSLVPDSLLELESKLNNTVSFYNQKLYDESSQGRPDSALIQEYNEKIFEANHQRDELNRLLEEEYPDYYDLKYSNSMLTINDIQKDIAKKDAILEYVLNESDTTQELFTILITKDKKEIIRQVLSDEMAHSMQYIFNFMTTPNYIFTRNEDSKEFCMAANNMYKLLIEPFSNDIEEKNLTIIPDGKLNYIAFDGLLRTIPDTSQMIDFSKLDYLVRDFNVNYANSANILLKYKKPKRNISNQILAFAPEYNSEKFKLSNATYTLLPLPGVQKEVDEISEIVKSRVFRGKDASEENFRKLNQNFDILHLAMHAYINDSLPAFSRLAFSPEKNEKDIQKDGWLNTTDIYNLDLKNVRLTVLSACNTGIGKMQKGEGLMSLARGFLYAGCPSIVMSLWEVEDNAGTKIMTSFYKNLKRGKTKDAALRAAKIEYLENANSRLAHPHYWMSFKCIGDNSPVYNSSDIYFFALLIVLILFFSIDQGIRIRKARRKRQAS